MNIHKTPLRSLPKLPRVPKPKGYYTRLYFGGILDGRKESVPFFRVTQPIKTTVNKSSWECVRGLEPFQISNIYTLTEPAQRPTNNATCIYQAQ